MELPFVEITQGGGRIIMGKMCNDCWLSMQNCHDASICCESEEYEGDECGWFEPIDEAEEANE